MKLRGDGAPLRSKLSGVGWGVLYQDIDIAVLRDIDYSVPALKKLN